MINLLSDAKKAEIRAARTNTILLRYILVLLLSLAFIGGIIYMSYQSLKLSEESALAQLDGSLGSSSQTATPAEINAHMANSSSTAKILTDITNALPAGSIIRSITIDQQHTQGAPFTLAVYAKSGLTEESVEQSLLSSGAFAQVTIKNTRSNDTQVSGYPLRVELTVALNTTTAGVITPPQQTIPPRSEQ